MREGLDAVYHRHMAMVNDEKHESAPLAAGTAQLVEMLARVSGLSDPVAIQREFLGNIGLVRPVDGYVSVSRRGLKDGEYKITRQALGDSVENVAKADPWASWEQMPTHTGGILGSLVSESRVTLIEDLRHDRDPVLGDALAPYRTLLAAPLFDNGEPLNWGIILHREPAAYTEQDVNDFLLRGNLVGRMTKSLVVQRELETLHAQKTDEIERIARIQAALLPRHTPTPPGLNVASSFLTSTEAGGDYYDFFEMSGGRFGVLIADVSGHGAGAAVVVAMMHAILQAASIERMSPAAVLEIMNEELTRKRIENTFVTAFFGVFDRKRRTLTFANAGHNPPVLHRKGGEIKQIRAAAGIPLGIIEDQSFDEASIPLELNDTLVMYTDGITEAFDGDRNMFGVDGLVGSLNTCTGDPSCTIGSIHTALFDHTGLRTRDDDQTIVSVRVTE